MKRLDIGKEKRDLAQEQCQCIAASKPIMLATERPSINDADPKKMLIKIPDPVNI
jgi:hypothetical protein